MSFTQILEYIQGKSANIIWILILFLLGKVLLSLIVSRAVQLADDHDEKTSEREAQTRTLARVLVATGNVLIYGIILLMILDLFSIDITPILAGAGIVGLAVGFGAQTLVKDWMSGLFILLEHRYSIGDTVKIDNLEGEVVHITMRSTVLRDEEGKVSYISNGSISKVINLSQADHKWG